MQLNSAIYIATSATANELQSRQSASCLAHACPVYQNDHVLVGLMSLYIYIGTCVCVCV